MTREQAAAVPFRQQLLHIGVLSAFALAQPLFDLLGRNAEFFAVRQSAPADVILMTLTLVLAVPVAAILPLWLTAQRLPTWHQLFFYGAVLLLSTLTLLPLVSGALEQYPWVAIGASLFAAGVFTLYYSRKAAVRMVLTVLTPSIVLFPVLFLFNSPVYGLVEAREVHSTASPPVPGTAPVVLLIFDELPLATLTKGKSEFDGAWFPSFTDLARHATWYRNASTVADYTTHAVPAVLTGRYPNATDRPGKTDPKADMTAWIGMPTAREHPDNLFTVLGEHYRLKVHETVTSLCPESLCPHEGGSPNLSDRLRSLFSDLAVIYAHIVTPRKLSSGLPSITLGWSDFLEKHGVEKADDTQDFMRFVDSIDAAKQPTLYFHHSTLPHFPWVYMPSGERHEDRRIPGLEGERWVEDDALVDQGYLKHLYQSRYTDHLLGILLQKLRRQGIFDRALVVLTADHGASFKAGSPMRAVTLNNHHDILSVPLIIKYPYQFEARIDDRPAETIDILPTIADVLDVRLPFAVDGESLLAASSADTGRRVAYNKDNERLTVEFDYRNFSDVRVRKDRLRSQLGEKLTEHSRDREGFETNDPEPRKL
jgi:hypothetical protein